MVQDAGITEYNNSKDKMKKILITLALAALFTACGSGGESTGSDSDSTANVTSTTPPPTADSTEEIGVMMGDTTTTVYDSVDGGKE